MAGARSESRRRAGFIAESRVIEGGHDVALTVSLRPRPSPKRKGAPAAKVPEEAEIKDPFAR
jgi:hypothetical protein